MWKINDLKLARISQSLKHHQSGACIMSVNAISHVANIWSRATALSSAPSPQGIEAPKPNEAGGPKPKPGQAGAAPSATPFQTLSSDLQSALIQLQAQKKS